jgi:hypothetical protein
MARSISKIKLFRGDQILIPGIESIFSARVPEIEGGKKKRNKARKSKLQRPVQLSLLDLVEKSLAGG